MGDFIIALPKQNTQPPPPPSTLWKFLYNVPYFIFSRQLGKEPQYKYFQHTLENIINHANVIHSQNKTSLQVIKADKIVLQSHPSNNYALKQRQAPLLNINTHCTHHTVLQVSTKCIQSSQSLYILVHLHTHSLSGSPRSESVHVLWA